MIETMRQTVRVQPGGVVHFESPELPEGAEAEIVVRVDPSTVSERRLITFRQLQKSLALTDAQADQWIRQADEERKVFGS